MYTSTGKGTLDLRASATHPKCRFPWFFVCMFGWFWGGGFVFLFESLFAWIWGGYKSVIMYFCTHLSYKPEHGGPFSSNSGFQTTGMRTSSTHFLHVSSSQGTACDSPTAPWILLVRGWTPTAHTCTWFSPSSAPPGCCSWVRNQQETVTFCSCPREESFCCWSLTKTLYFGLFA